MRVGFDGRALVSPAAGVRRYTQSLFGAMAAIENGPEVVAIGAPPNARIPLGVEAASAPSFVPTNLGWTAVSIPLACRRARIDLYHAPAYTAPLWGARPLVLTIHDCSYERRPHWYPYRRDRARRLFYRQSARAADVIITDSGFSKKEIIAAYAIDPDRITVVPLGAPNGFRPGTARTAKPRSEGRPYVLHVGDLHPRRDLVTAVAALAGARRASGVQTLRLVLVGIDRGYSAALDRAAAEAGVADAIERRRDVTDAELVALYQGATALIYPSRYEGFGLPLVEAMACGTPVIAARAGAIPEVVGEAGVLVDPGDVGEFARSIARMLTDAAHRDERGAACRRRSEFFSWRRTAGQTVEVYHRAAARAGRQRRLGSAA